MSLEKKPFVRYTEGDEPKKDSFTVNLNEQERKDFEELKKILEQEKDATALKQLASIGAKTLLDPKTALILETIFKNKRKNKRLGIVTFEL
jgi:hypothetical protein